MSCEESRERITLSLYGDLSAAEEAALARHLLACADCRAEREALAATVSLLRRLSPPVPGRAQPDPRRAAPTVPDRAQPDLRRASTADPGHDRPDLRRLAAAAAILVAFVWGLATLSAPPRDRTAGAPSGHGAVNGPRNDSAPAPADVASNSGAGESMSAEERLLAASGPLLPAEEDRLEGLAAGPDAALALRAIEKLARDGSARSVPALRAALARPALRTTAFEALAARGALAEAVLIPALRDPALRRVAAAALARRADTAAIAALLAEAARGDDLCRAACRAFPASVALPVLVGAAGAPATREVAVELLLTTDGDTFRTTLLRACEEDPALRAAALARAAHDPSDPRAARFLLLALADPATADAARAAIAFVPVRVLRAAIAAGLREQAMRSPLAAWLTSRVEEAAARDLLASLLDDASLRPAAARALLACGDLRPVPILLRSAAADDIDAFGTLSPAPRRRELVRALRARDLRPGALQAIDERDTALWREIVPFLADPASRGAAADALARAGADDAVPYLIPHVARTRSGTSVRQALTALVQVDLGEESHRWSQWWRSGALR